LIDAVQIVDDPEGFADAVVSLLSDVTLRETLATRGRAAVAQHFSAGAGYRAFLEELAAGAR
jgi:hypothetical protein